MTKRNEEAVHFRREQEIVAPLVREITEGVYFPERETLVMKRTASFGETTYRVLGKYQTPLQTREEMAGIRAGQRTFHGNQVTYSHVRSTTYKKKKIARFIDNARDLAGIKKSVDSMIDSYKETPPRT